MQVVGVKAWWFLSAAPCSSLLALHCSLLLTAPLPQNGSPMACEEVFAVGGLLPKLAYTSALQRRQESEMGVFYHIDLGGK